MRETRGDAKGGSKGWVIEGMTKLRLEDGRALGSGNKRDDEIKAEIWKSTRIS